MEAKTPNFLFLPDDQFHRAFCRLQQLDRFFVVLALDGDTVHREKLIAALQTTVAIGHTSYKYCGPINDSKNENIK